MLLSFRQISCHTKVTRSNYCMKLWRRCSHSVAHTANVGLLIHSTFNRIVIAIWGLEPITAVATVILTRYWWMSRLNLLQLLFMWAPFRSCVICKPTPIPTNNLLHNIIVQVAKRPHRNFCDTQLCSFCVVTCTYDSTLHFCKYLVSCIFIVQSLWQ